MPTYTLNEQSALSRSTGSGRNATLAQLSDGTLVFVTVQSGHVKVYYQQTRGVAPVLIADMTTIAGTALTNPLNAQICVDNADNLYVLTAVSVNWQAQAFVKGSGYTWTLPTGSHLGMAYDSTFDADLCWVNTGGGTNAKGHLLMGYRQSASASGLGTFDAGALLAGTAITNFTGTSGGYGTGATPCIALDGFGATTGIAVMQNNGGTQIWALRLTISSAGAITMGTALVLTGTAPALGTASMARPVRLSAGKFMIVGTTSGGALTAGVLTIGSPPTLTATWVQIGGGVANTTFNYDKIDFHLDVLTANTVQVIYIDSVTTTQIRKVAITWNGAGTVTWAGASVLIDTMSAAATIMRALRIVPLGASATYGDVMVAEGTTVTEGTGIVYYAPPFAPTLTAPANASYSDLATAGGPFTWTFNTTIAGETQAAYALRRKISGAGSYEYWNAGTNAWQSTIVWNTTASTTVTFGAGKWTNGNIYNWSVATQGSLGPGGAGSQGPFAADNTVTANNPPSVVITSPAGTTASSSPSVSWTDTLPSGSVQTNYRIVIESGAYGTTPGSGTSVYDSGVVAGSSTTATPPTVLVNGTTYRYFVQVTETGGQVSPWAYSTVTASFTPPATPTLTAVADPTNGRITLTLHNNDAGAVSSGIIEFSDNGGTTWTTLRGTGALNLGIGATLTIYDYEAVPKVARSYRARVSNIQALQTVTSLNAAAGPVTFTPTTWWVKDINVPTLNKGLCDAQQNVRNRKGDSVAVYPAGRTLPLALRGPVHGADGNFRTVVNTEADRTAVLALFAAQDPILIQDPRGRQWYAEWIGDLTESPFTVDQPYYAIQRGWVEVDVPG